MAESLIYVHDSEPGIRRRRSGRGFTYLLPDGGRVTARAELERVRGLAIPPAWTEVWICRDPLGHLQATGRDAKNRKQYIYHPEYRRARDEAKFHHLLDFGRVLPRVREAVNRDLSLPDLPRRKVLATIVHLLQTTLIRIGNEDYARQNGSYGLTTLRNAHVEVEKSILRFNFKGKSGKAWSLRVTDRRIAAIVRSCQELPGQALFQYLDEGGDPHDVTSTDVNAYLREIVGSGITAKDFRTWAATVMMVDMLSREPPPGGVTRGRRVVGTAMKQVGKRLGNTVAVCRRCYVHPGIPELYLAGRFGRRRGNAADLSPEEAATLTLLRRWRREKALSPAGTDDTDGH